MPGLVMVPKNNRITATSSRNRAIQKHQEEQQQQQQQSVTSKQSATSKMLHAYSMGEESFESILALDSPFVKKDRNTTITQKESIDDDDDDDDDDFDPFKIDPTTGEGGSSTKSHSTTIAAVDALSSFSDGSAPGLIPPKMLVKFKVHEEVSSVASLSPHKEGCFNVYVQGTIQVRKGERIDLVPPLIPFLIDVLFFDINICFGQGPSGLVGCLEERSLCFEIIN
jgi:hypothetical protein